MPLFMVSSVALSVAMARLSVNARFSVLPAIVFHWPSTAGLRSCRSFRTAGLCGHMFW
jgi:hypothetical protein